MTEHNAAYLSDEDLAHLEQRLRDAAPYPWHMSNKALVAMLFEEAPGLIRRLREAEADRDLFRAMVAFDRPEHNEV